MICRSGKGDNYFKKIIIIKMLKKDKVKIKNNLDDGACLYRCMADYIYDNQKLKMNDKVLECIVREHRKKKISILEQTDIAERIQVIIVNWIEQ